MREEDRLLFEKASKLNGGDALKEMSDYNTANSRNPEDIENDISNTTLVGKVKALANTVNIGYALVNKTESFKDPVDQEFKDKQYGLDFNQDNRIKYLTSRPTKFDGFNGYLLDNPATSWEDLYKKERYFKELIRDKEIVSEEVPLAGQLLGGLVFGLADVDTLVTAGFGTIPKIANTLKNVYKANTVNKIRAGVYGTAVGAGTGLTNEALYQEVTGDRNNDDLINAVIFGAGIGGGLGLLAGKSKVDTVTGRNIKIDPELDRVKSEILQKEGTLKHAEKEKVRYEETLGYINKQTDSLDPATTMRNLELDKIQKADLDELDNIVIKSKTDLDELGLTAKTTTKELNTLNKRITEASKMADVVKESTKSLTKVEKKLSTVNPKLELAVTKLNEFKTQTVTANKKATKGYQKKLEQLTNKVKALKTEVSTLTKESKSFKSNIEKAPTKSVSKEEIIKAEELTNTLNTLNTKIDEVKNSSLTAVEKKKELKGLTKRKKEAYDNLYTKYKDDERLKVDFKKYEGVTKEQLTRDIVSKTNQYKELLTKLRNGEMTPDEYLMQGSKFESTIERLSNEIKAKEFEYNKLNDYFEVLKTEKDVPDWIRKIIISPISKLQTSSNSKIRALARMLHAGTIHTGAIVGTTAHRIKSNLDNVMNKTNIQILSDYNKAVREGVYSGKYEEYKSELMTHHYKALDDLHDRANTYRNPSDSLEKQREDFINGLNSEQLKYSDSVPSHFQNSSRTLSAYYEGIHAYGKRLGVEGFMFSPSKGYINRVYSMDKINELGFDEAQAILLDAMLKKQANLGKTIEVDSAEYLALKNKAYGAIKSALDRKERILSMVESSGERYGGKESPFQTREIDVDYSDIRPLLEDNLEVLTSVYAFRTHGNLALHDRLGVHNHKDLEKLLDDVGASPSEKRYLRIAFDTIKGNREILQNPYSAPQRLVKMLGSLSNVMHVGGFGANTLSEVATMTARYGFANSFKKLWGASKDVAEFYRTGTISDKNQMMAFVHLHTSKTNSNITNVENFNIIEGADKVQRFLDGTSHKLAVWGGMLPMTDIMRTASMSAGLDQLARYSVKKNLTKADIARLEGYGLTVNDLPKLREVMQVSDDGLIGNYEIKSFGDLEQRVLDGLLESVDRTIMNGNGMTLPPFLTDSGTGTFVSKILFKFMRYPVESYERLLLRGIQEGDAQQIMSVALNTMIWTGVYMIKDAILPEEKKKYNGDDWEGKLLKDSLMMNSWLGVLPMTADFVAGYGYGENVTNDFKPSNVVWNDFKKFRSGVLSVNIPFSKVELDLSKGTGYALGLTANFGEYLKVDNEE